jgi:hypothetical protein
MTATEVILRDEMGFRVPSVSKVTVTQGGQVTFKAADADTALYFPPATAAILSPKPGTRVDIAAGKSVVYTFSAANAAVYGVVAEAPEDPAPTRFDFAAATEPPVLEIKSGRGTDFPGPTNSPGG